MHMSIDNENTHTHKKNTLSFFFLRLVKLYYTLRSYPVFYLLEREKILGSPLQC